MENKLYPEQMFSVPVRLFFDFGRFSLGCMICVQKFCSLFVVASVSLTKMLLPPGILGEFCT